MRILLIDPPFHRFMGFYRFYFPLGLTYIAAVLKRDGHEVLIYDADHDHDCISAAVKDTALNYHYYLEGLENDLHPIWSELRQLLSDFKPEAVGISVLTPKLAAAAKTAKIIKEYDSRIIVFVGGEHVTVRPQDMLKNQADYVVCGEGEEGVLFLFKKFREGIKAPQVIFSPLIEDLDTLPFPAVESLRNLYSYRPLDMGIMMDARGCPFTCNFCSLATIWGHRVRYHSIDRIISEIVLRQKVFDTDYFSFRSGTFTLDRVRVLEFCRRLTAKGLKIKWECLTRVDRIDKSLVEQMREAGCDTIRVGIESGSEEILKYMNKSITLEQIRSAAGILNESGLFWSAYFMLGVPLETEKTIKETLDLIKEIRPPFVTLARFSPFPGTAMYNDAVKSGLINEDATDWTWAGNQSLNQSFVKAMDPKKFLALMEEAAQTVKEHNLNNTKSRSDARLKYKDK